MALNLSSLMGQIGNQTYDDQCEKWVEEQVYGRAGMFPSATTAWQAQMNHAVPGLNGIQPGDMVYFSDPNQPDGHTGIYQGNGKFISATYNGVQSNDIGQWQNGTGQKLLGYVPNGHGVSGTIQGPIGQDVTSAVSNYQQQYQQQQQQQAQQNSLASNAINQFQSSFSNNANQTYNTQPKQIASSYQPQTQPNTAQQWLNGYM